VYLTSKKYTLIIFQKSWVFFLIIIYCRTHVRFLC
jgi:hypothetical protein